MPQTMICHALVDAVNGNYYPDPAFASVIANLQTIIIKPQYIKDGNGNITGTVNDGNGNPIMWYWTKGTAADDPNPPNAPTPLKTFGPTAKRPTTLGPDDIGFCYFDKDLNYPVWWGGQKWRNANSVIV